jgi:hypothetical protein
VKVILYSYLIKTSFIDEKEKEEINSDKNLALVKNEKLNLYEENEDENILTKRKASSQKYLDKDSQGKIVRVQKILMDQFLETLKEINSLI